MAVSYTANGDSFISSKPRVWSEIRLPIATIGTREFDITPDGKQVVAILFSEDEKKMPANHLTILFNFFDELRRKAPVGGKSQ